MGLISQKMRQEVYTGDFTSYLIPLPLTLLLSSMIHRRWLVVRRHGSYDEETEMEVYRDIFVDKIQVCSIASRNL